MIVSERIFNVAGLTLTRPANTTAYAANDSVSDNATAASVTALYASPSDLNDQPIILEEIELTTNDTGLAANGQVRVWLYRKDPTLNSGVVGGDNAAFSNKQDGCVGTFSGTFRAMSDGGHAVLVADEGAYRIINPESGGQRLWYQLQTLSAFTPSGNSTTIGFRLKGFVVRA